MNFFGAFVTLLRFERQGRNRTRFEAADADRLAGFLAIAIGAIVDAADRLAEEKRFFHWGVLFFFAGI